MRRLCQMMDVHPSGYYAWRAEPLSERGKNDQRLLGLIKQSWLESGGVYGYRKITTDLRDLGERCGKHRVYRLMCGRIAFADGVSSSQEPLRETGGRRPESSGAAIRCSSAQPGLGHRHHLYPHA